MRPSRNRGEDSTVPSVLDAQRFLPLLRSREHICPSSEPTKTLPPAMAGEDLTGFSVLKVQRSESRFSSVPEAIPVRDGFARNIGQSPLDSPAAMALRKLLRSRQSSRQEQKTGEQNPTVLAKPIRTQTYRLAFILANAIIP